MLAPRPVGYPHGAAFAIHLANDSRDSATEENGAARAAQSPEEPPSRSTTLGRVSEQRTTTVASLPAESVPAVLSLLDEAERVDGARALSEQAELALRNHRESATHLGAFDGDRLVGYVQVADGPQVVAEGVVDPEHRRRGIGSALLSAAKSAANGPLYVWAHGGGEGARGLLTGGGATRVRRLLQMSREIDPLSVPMATLPDGVRIRPFVIGQDEEALLQVNAAAFADHPEQGRMSLADLNDRIAEPWFDPAGLLLLETTDTGELLGFHWTKVHPATDGQPAVGEVYVIGLAPEGQGRGLGRTLVVIGLAHLAGPKATPQGPVSQVILYVEADNASALAIYTGLRFSISHVDEQYLLG